MEAIVDRSAGLDIHQGSVVACTLIGQDGRKPRKVENTASPKAIANLAKGRLRRKLQPLALALTGRLTEHHRYLLAFHLRRLAAIEADISELGTANILHSNKRSGSATGLAGRARRHPRTIANLVRRLTSLGYGVTLCPKPA